MTCDITLVGHTVPWRFRDSARLRGWLDTRPWHGAGGVAVVRLPGESAREPLAAALRGAIFGSDAGASDLRLITLEPEDLADGFSAGLDAALGLAPAEQPWQRRDHLAAALRRRPTVLLAHAAAGLPPSLAEEARIVTDTAAKSPTAAPLTVLVCDTTAAPQLTPQFHDFSQGAPSLHGLDEDDSARRWAAYAHQRLAWDCAGDLDLALHWNASENGAEPVGGIADDAALETKLNIDAGAAFANLDEDTKTAAGRQVAQLARDPRAAQTADPEPALLPLLWSPSEGSAPRFRPWVARALFAHPQLPAARWLLRSCLVCQPLAAATLARCLELEAAWRAMSCPQLLRITGPRPPGAAEQQRRFILGNLPALDYPAPHPASPRETADLWAFATLGELIDCLAAARAEEAWLRPARQLRDLRNALAHGHYTGWAHCEMAWALSRSLLA